MDKPLTQLLQYDAALIQLEGAYNHARQRYDALASARPLEQAWEAARNAYRPSTLDRASTGTYNAATRAYLASAEPAAAYAAAHELVHVEGRYRSAVQAHYLRLGITQRSAKELVNRFWDTHSKPLAELFQQLRYGRTDATKRLIDFYWGLKTDSDWYSFFICLVNCLDRAQLLTLAPYVRHSMQPFFNRALFIQFALDYTHGRPFQLSTDRAQR
jgi:hypothetical protein